MEVYKEKEYDVREIIDDIDGLSTKFETYVKSVDLFISHLLDDTESIVDLKKENKRLNNIINELEKWLNCSIEIINKKLKKDKEETIVKDGLILNMNNYQILRLKTFRTKMIEVLDKLKELKERK